MPRLSHSLLRRAHRISPLLPTLLQGTRTLESATNELRWLKEHVEISSNPAISPQKTERCLLNLCKLRAIGKPLQYILGSQPFGDLDIKCNPRVLIPRPETEAYTICLANLVKTNQPQASSKKPLRPQSSPQTPTKEVKITESLRILDICSGSGCISLLLYKLLQPHFPNLQIQGLDISKDAVALANENWRRNIDLGLLPLPVERELKRKPDPQLAATFPPKFHVSNFMTESELVHSNPHVIILNPPYISPTKFNTETARSVRNWEPKLALVPPPINARALDRAPDGTEWEKTLSQFHSSWPDAQADVFYFRMMFLIRRTKTLRPRLLLMEIGDKEQAIRVVEIVKRELIDTTNVVKRIEIWRDSLDQSRQMEEEASIRFGDKIVHVRGSGSMRSVFVVFNADSSTPTSLDFPP